MKLFGISLIFSPHFYYCHPYFIQKCIIFSQKSKKQRIFLLNIKTFTTFADAFKPRWRNR